MSNSVEAMLNVPVSDKLALRAVVYTDNQGGYIDNVGGIRTALDSGRFRAAGTVRDNGTVVTANRAGFQAGSDFSGVNFLAANNSSLVENDFNDTAYAGIRLSGQYDFNDTWSLLVTHAQQQLDSEGVFFADPPIHYASEEYYRARFESCSASSWMQLLSMPHENAYVVYMSRLLNHQHPRLSVDA